MKFDRFSQSMCWGDDNTPEPTEADNEKNEFNPEDKINNLEQEKTTNE